MMTSRTRRLAFTAGFVVLFALTIWSWMPGQSVQSPGHQASETSTTVPPTSTEPAAASPAPSIDPPLAPSTIERQSYAIGLHELSGLSRAIPAGTVVELWVAWDPPVTKKPQYQRLIRSVIIEEVQPPFVPEGPFTVMLSVPAKRIGDLLYADRYGAISVTVPR